MHARVLCAIRTFARHIEISACATACLALVLRVDNGFAERVTRESRYYEFMRKTARCRIHAHDAVVRRAPLSRANQEMPNRRHAHLKEMFATRVFKQRAEDANSTRTTPVPVKTPAPVTPTCLRNRGGGGGARVRQERVNK